MRIAKMPRTVLLVAALIAAGMAGADVPETQRAEVDHLLAFIGASSCDFQRNGRTYGSERAVRHVLRKYNYFKEKIVSTEDFIEYSATRSTMSGKPYSFICSDGPVEAAGVLLAELARFRAAGSVGN